MILNDITYSETRKIVSASWAWTSSAGGAYSQASVKRSGTIERVVIDPGATAPTALYDIALNDEDGNDVLQGMGQNLSATVTTQLLLGDKRWVFEDTDEELYQTNLTGGSDSDIAGTELFTSNIDLTQETGAAIDFAFDASGATDDLVLALYKRRLSTWTGTEIAVWSATVDSDGTADIYTFDIDATYGAGYFRFGMVRSGSSDTFDIDVEMRRYHMNQFRGIAFDGTLTLVVSNAGSANIGTFKIYWS